jgi:hypothetical protein
MNDFSRTLQYRLPVFTFLGAATLSASGQTFQFNLRDANLGIRKEGAAAEVVVNLGPFARFSQATPGEVITITNVMPAQLAAALPELAGARWSVTSATISGDGGDPAYPPRSLWLSRERPGPDTPATPWIRQNTITQGSAANRVSSIGNTAKDYARFQSPDPLANTATVIVIPSGHPLSYGVVMGPNGNLGGTFGQSGSVEGTVPADFGPDRPARLDFFEMLTASGADVGKPGRHLGYFELRSDNTLTFIAAGGTGPVPQPARILLLTRTAGTSSVTFESVAGLMYRLRYTDALGMAAVSNWLTGAALTATGTNSLLEDATALAARFYAVETLP